MKELRKECDYWLQKIDDRGAISEQGLVNEFWPDGRQPKTKNPTVLNNNGDLELATDEPGSSIGYQILSDTDELADSWYIYNDAIPNVQGQTIYAVAHRKGFAVSDTIDYDLNQ